MRSAAAPPPPASTDPSVVRQAHASAAMRQLRARHRPVFMVAAAMAALYVVVFIGAYLFPTMMDLAIVGPLSVGLLLVLALSILTLSASWWYGRYTTAMLDPLAEQIRTAIEQPAGDR